MYWFPRTTSPQWEGDRYAVYSPANHLTGLSRPGWFIASRYCQRPRGWDPSGEHAGDLPSAYLDEIEAKLENHFWDNRGRR